MEKPELLVPAGNLEKLKIGLQYGADAFYLGLPPFSMRSRINEFSVDDLLEGMKMIRAEGKTAYLTLNIYPRGNKVEAFKNHIEFIQEKVKPDALIVADAGVFDMIREYYPEGEIHMSVQTNILNYKAVDFWKKAGASRIILPRELTLPEIKKIHKEVPDIDLETFVHGAICIAYSGRCLLSSYMTDRDANQGMCAQSCRWKYKVHLEEEKRPGEMMPAEEDEHGTYIMNSKDMCLLPFLKDLWESGVSSFKIEGRNKTEHYLATVTRAYRKAIDDMVDGRKFDEGLLTEVGKTANRGFIPGFLKGFPGEGNVYYEKNAPIQTHKFIGIVKEGKGDGKYLIEVRNKLEQGSKVEVMTPEDQFECKVSGMWDLEGEEVEAVHGGAGEKVLKLKKGIVVGAMLRQKL